MKIRKFVVSNSIDSLQQLGAPGNSSAFSGPDYPSMTSSPKSQHPNVGRWLSFRRGGRFVTTPADTVDLVCGYSTPAAAAFAAPGMVGVTQTEDGVYPVVDPAAFSDVTPCASGPDAAPARLMLRIVAACGPLFLLCDDLSFHDEPPSDDPLGEMGAAEVLKMAAGFVPAAFRPVSPDRLAPFAALRAAFAIVRTGNQLNALPTDRIVSVSRTGCIRRSVCDGVPVVETDSGLLAGFHLACAAADSSNNLTAEDFSWALTIDDGFGRRALLASRVEELFEAAESDLITVDHTLLPSGSVSSGACSRWLLHPLRGLIEIIDPAASPDFDRDRPRPVAPEQSSLRLPTVPGGINTDTSARPAFSLRSGPFVIAVPAAATVGVLGAGEIGEVFSARGPNRAPLFDLAALSGTSEAASNGGFNPRPAVVLTTRFGNIAVCADDIRLTPGDPPWRPPPALTAAAAGLFSAVRMRDGRAEFLLRSSRIDVRSPAVRLSLRRGFVGWIHSPLHAPEQGAAAFHSISHDRLSAGYQQPEPSIC